jgi:hypothetical protein
MISKHILIIQPIKIIYIKNYFSKKIKYHNKLVFLIHSARQLIVIIKKEIE